MHTIAYYHHRHKVHHLLFASFLAVTMLSFLGMLFMVFGVWAAEKMTVFSLSISDPAIVSEPPTAIVGSSESGSRFAYLSKPVDENNESEETETHINLVNIFFEVFDSNNSFIAGSQDTGTDIPKTTDTQPTFSGSVGMKNALIFLELHSNPTKVITTSLSADENGFWSWRPLFPLSVEVHTLYITVFDPTGEILLGSKSLIFEVISPPQARKNLQNNDSEKDSVILKPRTSIVIPPSLVEQRKVLFDIQAKIVGLDEPNEISAGDSFLVQVSLSNIGSPGYIVDTEVSYKFIDESGKVIFEERETVGVSTRTSFLKSFRIKPTLPNGNYKIRVGVKYEDTEAISYDDLTIIGEPIVPVSASTHINITIIFQILMTLLVLGLLITYLEYRQVEFLKKIIHQVTEQDLIQKNYIH